MRKWMLAAAMAVFGSTAQAATVPWSELLVFGDSLSDAGNFGGTATNGQTWAGQLGALPALGGGTNFAFGGARAVTNADGVPDFTAQRLLYEADRPALGSTPLTVAWFGGNDLLAITPSTTAQEAGAIIAGALAEIGTGVADLAQDPALRRFILPNLPDLSRIPLFANAGEPIRVGIAQVTAAFNGGLSQLAAGFTAQGLDVKVFDTAGIFASILDDPAAFGFDPAKVDETCLQGAISCDGYIFWDPIHPTAATHALIADGITALAQPAPVPLPATGWLLLGALGGAAALRRQRRAA